MEVIPDKYAIFFAAKAGSANRRNGDRQFKMKVTQELFFPYRMGVAEPGAVGSLPLTAAQDAAQLFPPWVDS